VLGITPELKPKEVVGTGPLPTPGAKGKLSPVERAQVAVEFAGESCCRGDRGLGLQRKGLLQFEFETCFRVRFGLVPRPYYELWKPTCKLMVIFSLMEYTHLTRKA